MANINNNTCDELAQSLIITQYTNWHHLTADLVTYSEKINNLAVQLADERHIAYHTRYRDLLEKLMNAEKKAKAAEEAKADFLDNMRHDLRTPLGNIVGLGETLQQKSDLNEQGRLYIDKIVTSGRQILRFLTEILEFDNIDSGQKPLHFIQIDICDIIDEVGAIISAAISNKSLRFDIDIEEDIPANIIGDKFRIQMILLNLLSNAVKFTDKGQIRLSAGLGKENGMLCFQVKDTGVGIPAEKFEFVLRKFTRLTASYQGRYEGLGLGLYMVDKFIKELGGKLKITSELGKGTVFDFVIPFQLS